MRSAGAGRYAEVGAIFLLLFITIVLVDQVSSYFRELLTHGRARRES